MDYNFQKQAFFNAAMGSVIRLDTSLNAAQKCRHEGNYAAWLNHLQDIRLECVPKWNEEIVKKCMELLNRAAQEVIRYGRVSNGQVSSNIVQGAYQSLMIAEEFMRINADKVGLLNPNKSDIMSGLGDVD